MRVVGPSLAGILLLTFACQAASAVTPSAAGGARDRAGVSPPPPSLRQAAVLSVYVHAQAADANRLPAELRPLDLAEAARVLRSASDPMAPARRLRAVARLTVAGLEDRGRCEAVRTLLGGSLAPLASALASPAAAGSAAPLALPDACPAQLTPPGPPDQAMAAIYAHLSQVLLPPVPPCLKEYHPAVIDHSAKSQATTVNVKTAVQRPFPEVCTVMDPQRWDQNQCSAFFPATYVAQKTGNDYEVDADFNVPQDPLPPPPCSTYDRDLFEHFAATFNGVVTAWFKNLLTIDSHPQPVDAANPTGGHVYAYELLRSLGSEVYLDRRAGGLDIDDGTITLRPRPADPTWTEIHVTKTLRFHGRVKWDYALNLWAGAYLEAMADELPVMACCP